MLLKANIVRLKGIFLSVGNSVGNPTRAVGGVPFFKNGPCHQMFQLAIWYFTVVAVSGELVRPIISTDFGGVEFKFQQRVEGQFLNQLSIGGRNFNSFYSSQDAGGSNGRKSNIVLNEITENGQQNRE